MAKTKTRRAKRIIEPLPQIHRKRQKKFQLRPENANVIYFEASIFLSKSMREIARRKKAERRMFIDAFYTEAFNEYLDTVEVPKRIIKVNRQPVRIQMNEDGVNALNDIAKLAYKQERPMGAIVDEALRMYANKPENYLGKSFIERFKNEYEEIK